MLNAFRHHRNSHLRTSFAALARALSAQRLSASSEFSLPRPRVVSLVTKCSTPFGIIGILTSTFRVLTESTYCAQRLSASSEFSRHPLPRKFHRKYVLNAFRHHRNSHCAGPNPLVCSMFQVCFRASPRFTLTSRSLNADCPCLRLTIAQESDT